MNKIIKIIIGLALFFLTLYWSPIEGNPAANQTLATALLMIFWWISNAMHFSFTALVPAIVFPFFHIVSFEDLRHAYFHRLIFLLFGGFLIAAAIQKWNLHKRIALHIILLVGTNMKRLIMGFMISCAFLSMWVSNTATTMMMLPIGLSVISYIKSHNEIHPDHPFPTLLMLSIAYSSSIGGMATIIGTAPNAFTVSYLAVNHHMDISFIEWFSIGLPFVIISIPLSYFVLTRIAFNIADSKNNNGYEVIKDELTKLGKVTRAERLICIIFLFVVIGWILQPWIAKFYPIITDALIACTGGGLMFVICVSRWKPILSLKDLKTIPWGIILLLGGGLALATAVKSSGLADYIAQLFYFAKTINFPALLLISIVTIILLSEFTSNTATTAAFIPIIATIATNFNLNPILLIFPATLAASCAFMLPVATPPNAIAFGSGYINMLQMARAGMYMNILFIIILFFMGLILKLVIC